MLETSKYLSLVMMCPARARHMELKKKYKEFQPIVS